ncbi:MAG TPA: phosphate ABC transporter substrate-binding protein PstS [Urbifossiella sp.]|jgi:phosphate transport system substrate-binding protein
MRNYGRSLFIPVILAVPISLFGCGKTAPTDNSSAVPLDPKLAAILQKLEPANPTGQGATFVKPIMDVWTEEFIERTGGKVKINYTGTGSGAGISQMTKKLSDFGCSDNPMTRKQLAEVPEGAAVVHIPLVVGAVVPAYNLPGVEQPIKFTGPLLVEIFTGKIAKWNDPRIAAINPGVSFPDLVIQPVYRADPSGTTFIFCDYLAKVDDSFKKTIGVSNAPTWPKGVGIGQNKSDGVAGHISRTEGAIGYIELTYALDSKDKLKFGSVRNKAGRDVIADLDSITAAADASLDQKPTEEPYSLHELTYNLTDAAGEKSYPIAGMSFAVLYKKQQGATGRAVVAFLRWATSTEGQALAKQRNFAPLPASLREKISARLDGIEVQ